MKQLARIDDWSVVPGPDGPLFLVGRVSGHPRQHEFLTDTQVTSRLVSFQPTVRLAETENTIYDLGTPAVGTEVEATPVFCENFGGCTCD